MRMKEFQGMLRKRKIGCAVIVNPDGRLNKNFLYFTDVSDVKGILVVPSSGSPVLITSILEYDIAKKHSRIKKVVVVNDSFKKILKKHIKGKVVGIDFNNTTVITLKALKKDLKVKFVDVSKEISRLRTRKTPEEILRMRKAAAIACDVIKKAIQKANSRMTEKQLADFIDTEFFRLGLKNSFPTIVASGNNARNPHHVPSNEKLRGFTVIDMGVVYRNYCSDITRTCYVGKPSAQEIADYDKVLKVQEECISMIGKPLKTLNDYAKKKLGKHFIHSLGHGIGLDVHEMPSFNEKKRFITPTVITIEPGIYHKYGIRIEDDVLADKKVEVLTKFRKKLIVKR